MFNALITHNNITTESTIGWDTNHSQDDVVMSPHLAHDTDTAVLILCESGWGVQL